MAGPNLVAEDLLQGQATDGTNLLQGLHVQFLLVTEDEVTIGLAGHGRLLKVDHILQRQAGQSLLTSALFSAIR